MFLIFIVIGVIEIERLFFLVLEMMDNNVFRLLDFEISNLLSVLLVMIF